jgi:ATPase subunit of ABC transporter with duplicated ATPase domains
VQQWISSRSQRRFALQSREIISMPASITLSNLSWSTPDGRNLFSNIDLSFSAERAGFVGRNGVGKTTILKLVAGDIQPQTGSVSVQGRIGMMRQSVQVDDSATVADLFGVTTELALLSKVVAGDATVDEIATIDWLLEERVAAALSEVGLDAGPEARLATLSGGQRTRAGLASLVFREPDFLLLDEPTNNLDRDGRAAVIDLLSRWRGGAIVVSHDRELLETMDAIIELTTIGARRYGGNWNRFQERKVLELAAAQHDLADAEKTFDEIARTAQVQAERKARKDSAGIRKADRGDMPRIVAGGLKMQSEATSGENARLAMRRNQHASEAIAEARKRIEILQPFSVHIASTGLPAAKTVMRLDHASVGYGDGPTVLSDVSFDLVGPERVAIVGSNGSGKTTLIRAMTGAIAPSEGTVSIFTEYALLDQTVSLLEAGTTIRDNFRRLNPDADENTCRAALARFMFRADAALQPVSTLSGGQLLRAGLACVIGGANPPPLLILDEPTNHLDLDSIATVERGLSAYDGALLVISHDEVFLDAIGITRRLELPARTKG